MAQVVEHILGKDEVGSSSLPSSSRNPVCIVQTGFLLFIKRFAFILTFTYINFILNIILFETGVLI